MLPPSEIAKIFHTLDNTKVQYTLEGRTVLKLRNGESMSTIYHKYKVILKYKGRQYTTSVFTLSENTTNVSGKCLLNEIFSQYAAYLEERTSATGIPVRHSELYPQKKFQKDTEGLQRLYGATEFPHMLLAFKRGMGEAANMHPRVQSFPKYPTGI